MPLTEVERAFRAYCCLSKEEMYTKSVIQEFAKRYDEKILRGLIQSFRQFSTYSAGAPRYLFAIPIFEQRVIELANPGYHTEELSQSQNAKSSECCVCMDAEANIIFIPCGHLCSCQECSKEISFCPMCQKGIAMTQITYKS
jgi:hypothetical protein